MQLDNYMKIKINEIIQKNTITNIFYEDFTTLIKKTKNKYKNEDIVLYLIERFTKELSKENPKLLSKIVFSIDLITDYSDRNYIRFSKDTTDKIINSVINCTEIEFDEQLNKAISELTTTLEYCYPQLALNQDAVQDTSEDLKELETKLIQAKETIMELEKKITELEKKINTQSKANKNLKKQKIDLTNLKNSLEIEINHLRKNETIKNNEFVSLMTRLETYDIEYKELLNKIEEMTDNYKKESQTLISNNNQLKEELKIKSNQLTELEKQNKEQQEEQLRHNKINEIILTELYKNKNVTIETLTLSLQAVGIYITNQQIHEHLIELRQNINIEGPLFSSFPPIYTINKPVTTITKPFEYYIEDGIKELNILVISDMHIINKLELSTLQTQNDILYNYSAINNIKMIFNLGDTFEIYGCEKERSFENLKLLESLINKFVAATPTNTGIYQGILGGNHDKELLRFGINPLEIISVKREDFINLGYNQRKIQLGNAFNQIMLHHPEQRFQEFGFFDETLENYFYNIYYSPQSRNNIYCDLLGHTHKSKLDIANSYCLIPSYRKDRIQNGCWHLKIYFDANKNISYINFIPLIVCDNKLIPTTEITYQKVRKK